MRPSSSRQAPPRSAGRTARGSCRAAGARGRSPIAPTGGRSPRRRGCRRPRSRCRSGKPPRATTSSAPSGARPLSGRRPWWERVGRGVGEVERAVGRHHQVVGGLEGSAVRYRTVPSGATCWIPDRVGRVTGGSSKSPMAAKSSPPFWVTRTPVRWARVAPLLRPRCRRSSTSRRWSRRPGTGPLGDLGDHQGPAVGSGARAPHRSFEERGRRGDLGGRGGHGPSSPELASAWTITVRESYRFSGTVRRMSRESPVRRAARAAGGA